MKNYKAEYHEEALGLYNTICGERVEMYLVVLITDVGVHMRGRMNTVETLQVITTLVKALCEKLDIPSSHADDVMASVMAQIVRHIKGGEKA